MGVIQTKIKQAKSKNKPNRSVKRKSSEASSLMSSFTSSNIIKSIDALCYGWNFCLELANEYQSAEFVGIDRYKLFPSEIKPNNVNFLSADLMDGIPSEDNYFDFTHLNTIEPVLSFRNWEFIN
ncbi:unnamed protein product [Rhizophagus irregularis]|nr:unnamed protein product [Rhizophagus irregularis]